MNNLHALISIIVPVYNVEQYLQECLDSIINQDYLDIEIICVNDGSTDKSGHILKKYADRDSRVIVVDQENAGLSEARNTGIEYATGKYIMFVDSDDMLVPGALAKIADKMELYGLDLLTFAVELKNENIEWTEDEFSKYGSLFIRKQQYEGIRTGAGMFVDMQSSGDFQQPVWMLCIRKDMLIEYNINFEKKLLHEDIIFSVLCYLNAERAMYYSEKCYIYRVRNNSLSRIEGSKWRLDSLVRIYYLLLEQIHLFQSDYLVVQALSSYINDLLCTIQIEKNRLFTKEAELEADNALMDMLYCGLRIGKYQRQDIDRDIYYNGFQRKLDEARDILIYGAGHYGKAVYKFILKNNYQEKVYGFVVSDQYSESSYMGKPIYNVYAISDDFVSGNPLIIISTDVRFHDDIKNICFERGFTNVVCLDYVLQCLVAS